jgi:hypothetical protein
MREILELEPSEAMPKPEAVLRMQGIPEGARTRASVRTLLEEALRQYRSLARPRAVWADVSVEAFAEIYQGEGQNAPETPLELVYPRAAHLVLFALTVGEGVSEATSRLLRENEPALGAMLDAVASEGADRAVRWLERRLIASLLGRGAVAPGSKVLAYSPGYCGWHVTGQRKLFARLQPGEIGVSLNQSCLMRPLKSVSGVLLAGDPSIHFFDNAYAFCADCTTQECRDRMAALEADARRTRGG